MSGDIMTHSTCHVIVFDKLREVFINVYRFAKQLCITSYSSRLLYQGNPIGQFSLVLTALDASTSRSGFDTGHEMTICFGRRSCNRQKLYKAPPPRDCGSYKQNRFCQLKHRKQYHSLPLIQFRIIR